ncbi:MAG: MarC family transcriptional regulator [Rhodobacteraceae bacterium]|nr:MarC family transcriptional regulator [Paracoccaceae bacterium]
MDVQFVMTAFFTLFVVIDPLGLSPMFIALTQGMSRKTRFGIALRACAVAAGVLTLFAVFGDKVLGYAGISMPAFRVAGGILLFLTALDMLFERRTKRRENQADASHQEPEHDPSVFPLAIPLIAGPGAIAAMILLAGQQPGVESLVLTLGVMLSVLMIVFALFLGSELLERALGPIGTNVVTRVLGMLLAALAVQFVMDGLTAFGFAG